MRIGQWRLILAGAALFAWFSAIAASRAEHEPNRPDARSDTAEVQPLEPSALGAAGFVQFPQHEKDSCTQGPVVASPSRPYWDAGAATTQCGILETDFGWLAQPMGNGMRQQMLVSSVRYGLTPRLDVRWGLINRISQTGGGLAPLSGIGDQSIAATYRFHEQGRRMPAMALGYGIKIPIANPAKGFGSGFVDHQWVLIASRDLGRNHIDFDIVGSLTGEKGGHDGASQFGVALTRQMSPKLAVILESYGGPQPGTADRYGAALTGLSYSLRPWLVLDGSWVKTYTAGSPRQQFAFGFTYSIRPGFGSIPSGSRFARILGR